MNYTDYENALSAARLNRYKNACGGNTNKALTLYRNNVKLCQRFYGILSVFEIVLRNAINRHYTEYFNDSDWIYKQLLHGGMTEHSPHQRNTLELINELSLSGKYTSDRIVASVSFGFWTYLFNKLPFRMGGQSILHIFKNKQVGLGQKSIYKELHQIKNFRNRIAHHEPICFDMYGSISMEYAQTNYNLILKYISFLGYDFDELFWGLDVIPDNLMNRILQQ